jgi:hypothetical protein
MAAWGIQTADTRTPLDCPTTRDQRRVAFVEFDSLRRAVNVRCKARLPRHTWTGPVSMTDRILPAGSVNHAIGVPRCGTPSGGGSCSTPPMNIDAHLFFPGSAAEAMNFYNDVFGGTLIVCQEVMVASRQIGAVRA